MTGRRQPAETVQALRRGLQILKTIAEGGGSLSLTQIAERVALHPSTTHHLVKTLQGMGYLAQEASNRAYRLGGRIFELAAVAWNEDEIARLAEPAVVDLGLKLQATSHLAVLDGREVIVMASHNEPSGLWRLAERVGALRPAYCTALGKAILAFLSEAALGQYLRATQLRAFTAKTITDRRRLVEEFGRIRRQGFAVDDEEYSEGIRCLAAPVLTFTGVPVAAIGVAAASRQMARDRVPALAVTVKEMGERVSRDLAYSGPYPPPSRPPSPRRAATPPARRRPVTGRRGARP